MIINVELEKTGNESNANLLRRFTKKVQGAAILNKVKRNRYKTRNESKYTRKKKTLKFLAKKQKIEELIKLGKIEARNVRQ